MALPFVILGLGTGNESPRGDSYGGTHSLELCGHSHARALVVGPPVPVAVCALNAVMGVDVSSPMWAKSELSRPIARLSYLM